jgi:hypothetical protein
MALGGIFVNSIPNGNHNHAREPLMPLLEFIISNIGSGLAIEVKSGVTVKGQNFKHMKWFKENLAGKRTFVEPILYAREVAVPFGKDLWAVPYGYLW